jgi:hypothetical protein
MATLAEVEAQLAAVNAAYLKAVKSASYTIGDRAVQHQKLEDLRNEISTLERQKDTLSAASGGSRKPASLACWNNCT